MSYRNIVSVSSKRLSAVILGGAVLLAMAITALASWDAPTNRYNPDGTGSVVGYDTSSCTGNSYIVLSHGTAYKNLTGNRGADGTQFNDKISCVIIGPKTKFEYWEDKNYNGAYGHIDNGSDQIITKAISGWDGSFDNKITSVKVWKILPPLPSGSYKNSCNTISNDGTTLTAHCKKKNGSWNNSAQLSIADCNKCTTDKGDITNCDGNIECTGVNLPNGGSYKNSCWCCRMEADNGGNLTKLSCHCNKKGSGSNWTSLDNAADCTNTNIWNNDGNLQCN